MYKVYNKYNELKKNQKPKNERGNKYENSNDCESKRRYLKNHNDP